MSTLLIGHGDGLTRIQLNGSARAEHVISGAPVASIAVDALAPSHAYAATLGCGVWRSTDASRGFERCTGFEPPLAWSVAVSRSDRKAGLGAVYVGTQPSALFRSTHGGQDFEELLTVKDIPSRPEWSFPPAPDTHHVHQIALDIIDPDTLVFGVELGGVFRSDDRGKTWVETEADPDPHTLVSHPTHAGRMYEGGGTRYCESRDSGASWRRELEGIPDEVRYFYSLAVDSGDPENVLISGARDPFSGHGVIPGAPVWSTLYRRSNGGPWEEITEGLPPADNTAMGTLAAAEPGVFYFMTEPGEIYRSKDGGRSFEHLPYTGERLEECRALAVLPD